MVLIAAILTLIAASGLFRAVDLAASDAFYQSRSASDGKIVLDISGKERDGMTVDGLLTRFRDSAGRALDNDRILLSK